jgi:translation initiation factor 2B subunit (eIF-2B alpha/beta/delta family)
MAAPSMTSDSLKDLVAAFELARRRHEHFDSKSIAIETLNLLEQFVAVSTSPEQVEAELIRVCGRLQSAAGSATPVSNVCARVICGLNEHLNISIRKRGLSEILVSSPSTEFAPAETDLQTAVLDWIAKLKTKITSEGITGERFARDYADYIHDGDYIMVMGASRSVCAFLGTAARHASFTALIPENAPTYDGTKMARKLRNITSKITCWVIPDGAVFATMPKVTTVFVPVRAIFADGTLVVASYIRPVSLAAKHYAKPLVVIYWKNKLTNKYRTPQESFTQLASPHDVFPYDDLVAKQATILNPDGEIMSSSEVTLFINEDGAHGPSDIFALVQDMYENEPEKSNQASQSTT